MYSARKGKTKRARESGFASQEATGTGVRAFREKRNPCFLLVNSVHLNLVSQCDFCFPSEEVRETSAS